LLTAALELHALSDGVYAVQQRAPLFDGCAALFMESIVHWIHSQSFSRVIFIAEAPCHRKVDVFLRKGSVFSLEGSDSGPANSASVHSVSREVGFRALGDSSFASQLMSRLATAKVLHSCIFAFSSGDPVSASFELAAEAAALSKLSSCELLQPASWSRSLLPPMDQSIFG
jgi:hypothetical protein